MAGFPAGNEGRHPGKDIATLCGLYSEAIGQQIEGAGPEHQNTGVIYKVVMGSIVAGDNNIVIFINVGRYPENTGQLPEGGRPGAGQQVRWQARRPGGPEPHQRRGLEADHDRQLIIRLPGGNQPVYLKVCRNAEAHANAEGQQSDIQGFCRQGPAHFSRFGFGCPGG